MRMNYYEIGQRIRKYRKACSLSQEQLAEAVDISVTHLSHIETGNTKLSLQVLVAIAEYLGVTTDELLYDIDIRNKSTVKQEILNLLDSCAAKDIYILFDILKSTKTALEKYSDS